MACVVHLLRNMLTTNGLREMGERLRHETEEALRVALATPATIPCPPDADALAYEAIVRESGEWRAGLEAGWGEALRARWGHE